MKDFSYERLDPLLHSRIRLAIVAALAGIDDTDFTSLRNLTGTTDGNLNMHLKKLECAGYITLRKASADGRSPTMCSLTDDGRRKFLKYVEEIEKFLQ